MFGIAASAFRYDPTLRASQEVCGACWRREGRTVVFGPEYAARVLDQEQSFLDSETSGDVASWAEWVVGLSAAELRKKFPEAIRDAEAYREIRPLQEWGEAKMPRAR